LQQQRVISRCCDGRTFAPRRKVSGNYRMVRSQARRRKLQTWYGSGGLLAVQRRTVERNCCEYGPQGQEERHCRAGV